MEGTFRTDRIAHILRAHGMPTEQIASATEYLEIVIDEEVRGATQCEATLTGCAARRDAALDM